MSDFSGLQQQEALLRSSDLELQNEAASSSNNRNASSRHNDDQPTGLSLTNKPESSHQSRTEISEPFPPSFRFVALSMGDKGRTHVVSRESASLLQHITLQDLQAMTQMFYQNAFQDATLDLFIRSHTDPHEARLAKWIHQKLTGSSVWDEDRESRDASAVPVAGGRSTVVHDRSSAHVAAWYSVKRPENAVGRHFTLEECRVWMRLHFLALRASGLLAREPSFADYYVRFIAHFVAVYERTAPMFARESLRWSEDKANVEKYLRNGRKMVDVLSLSFAEAVKQIPLSEFKSESGWPYNLRAEGGSWRVGETIGG
eukprot:GHVN01071582.1.p1 GENE.GHVN01071582.1~~GHVN01071582.1.p1  ORF type:complete len:315 (-),score=41.96 GHVN01071582.1:190-1134(-)